MEIRDRVSAILTEKHSAIWTISPDDTVFEALGQMAEKEIGALLVLEDQQLAGLFSERDYARKIILMGRSSKETTVREIMSSPPLTVTPECSVDDAMRLMTDQRVRHLPVLNSTGKLVGMISIGDLVKWIITSHEKTIQQLHSYITSA